MDNLQIRNAQLHEMPFLIDMASKEGWNPGLSDNDFFFKIDPNAYLVIFENGQPAGCIAAVNYNKFGFLGLHIIRPEFRDRGIGSHLFNIALQKLGDINIGLNCFPHQEKFYEKFGFKTAHKIITYEGITEGNLKMADNIVCPFMHPFDYIEQYDKKCFPTNRRNYLVNWLNQPKSLFLAKLDDNKFTGFGLFRPCINGYKIAPLFADDFKTADELFLALTGHFEKGITYSIDICETNEQALLLVEKHNLKKVNETLRMYNKITPEISLQHIYSFASFELG